MAFVEQAGREATAPPALPAAPMPPPPPAAYRNGAGTESGGLDLDAVMRGPHFARPVDTRALRSATAFGAAAAIPVRSPEGGTHYSRRYRARTPGTPDTFTTATSDSEGEDSEADDDFDAGARPWRRRRRHGSSIVEQMARPAGAANAGFPAVAAMGTVGAANAPANHYAPGCSGDTELDLGQHSAAGTRASSRRARNTPGATTPVDSAKKRPSPASAPVNRRKAATTKSKRWIAPSTTPTMRRSRASSGRQTVTPASASTTSGASARSRSSVKGEKYCRKEKSLGLLCENFLAHFGTNQYEELELDGTARELGVERRRIYDIVNILESVEVVSRKAKNCYVWHGTVGLASTLEMLRGAAAGDELLDDIVAEQRYVQEQERVNFLKSAGLGPNDEAAARKAAAAANVHLPAKADLSDIGAAAAKRASGALAKKAPAARREKSLGVLSQRFVQLFLLGLEIVSLEQAGRMLLGGEQLEPSKLKTRVRRLYDIANVLCSMKLIRKVQMPFSRKPGFAWRGVEHVPELPGVLKTPGLAGVARTPVQAAAKPTAKKRGRSSSASRKSGGLSDSDTNAEDDVLRATRARSRSRRRGGNPKFASPVSAGHAREMVTPLAGGSAERHRSGLKVRVPVSVLVAAGVRLRGTAASVPRTSSVASSSLTTPSPALPSPSDDSPAAWPSSAGTPFPPTPVESCSNDALASPAPLAQGECGAPTVARKLQIPPKGSSPAVQPRASWTRIG